MGTMKKGTGRMTQSIMAPLYVSPGAQHNNAVPRPNPNPNPTLTRTVSLTAVTKPPALPWTSQELDLNPQEMMRVNQETNDSAFI